VLVTVISDYTAMLSLCLLTVILCGTTGRRKHIFAFSLILTFIVKAQHSDLCGSTYMHDDYVRACFRIYLIICGLRFLNDYCTSVQAGASDSQMKYVDFPSLLSFMQESF
jgi:hypothetical protein